MIDNQIDILYASKGAARYSRLDPMNAVPSIEMANPILANLTWTSATRGCIPRHSRDRGSVDHSLRW
jgi:hypothetical protein